MTYFNTRAYPSPPSVPCAYCGGTGSLSSCSGPRQADISYRPCPKCEERRKAAYEAYNRGWKEFSAAEKEYMAGKEEGWPEEKKARYLCVVRR